MLDWLENSSKLLLASPKRAVGFNVKEEIKGQTLLLKTFWKLKGCLQFKMPQVPTEGL